MAKDLNLILQEIWKQKNPELNRKRCVGEDDISSIQILDIKEEGTNCPQGYEQKGRKDGFWW